MASGVSSTMISTPVAASMARILRPSLPMIRPLTSSESILKTETQFSTASSVPMRWMVWRWWCAVFSLGVDHSCARSSPESPIRSSLAERSARGCDDDGDWSERPPPTFCRPSAIFFHAAQIYPRYGQTVRASPFAYFAFTLVCVLAHSLTERYR